MASGAIDPGSSPGRGTMEKPIVFRNKRKKQLMGILHIPKGKGKFPLVVMCHGFGGTKTQLKFVRLARFLEKNKIASFRFDFEGCGDSEGKFETITVKRQISDFSAAIEKILRQKIIDKSKIAFVGHSLGAVVIVSFLTQTKFSAKTSVFWAPALNQKELLTIWSTKEQLREWKKKGYITILDDKIGSQYLKENEDKDYSLVLFQIKAPILTISGKKDETTPVRFSKELAKKYKNVKLKVYPEAEHEFEDYYVQQKLIRDTARWLKKHLEK